MINDISGDTGMKIIRAIVQGERDAKLLASYRDKRCKNPVEMIEKALTGNYREEHIFTLKQALELYEAYQNKIKACDDEIEKQLFQFENRHEISVDELENSSLKKKQKKNKNEPRF